MEPPESDGIGLAGLAKTNDVLSALETATELTVVQLSEMTGGSVASIYRTLGSLIAVGWVDHATHRGTYRLGFEFVRFASAVDRQLDIRSAVRPALEELHRRTGETSFLVVRSGLNAVCIERIEGVEVFSLAMRIGESLPLSAGAAPLALLASEPAELRAELLDALPLQEAARIDLHRRIDDGRDEDVWWSDEDVTPGIAACGAVVRDHRGRSVAAISVSGRRSGLLAVRSDITGHIRECAANATRALGWVDGVNFGGTGA